MKAIEFDTMLFDRAVNSLPSDALSELRSAAASEFMRNGFPTSRNEDWRYTDLSPAILLSNAWMARSAQLPAATVTPAQDIRNEVDAHWIRIANGTIDYGSLPEGVTIKRLSADFTNTGIAIDAALAR